MFVDTINFTMPYSETSKKLSPECLLAMIKKEEATKLRIYIGMAAGVGKTFRMLRDAHDLQRQGIDVVIGFIETHKRTETEAEIGELEQIRRARATGRAFEGSALGRDQDGRVAGGGRDEACRERRIEIRRRDLMQGRAAIRPARKKVTLSPAGLHRRGTDHQPDRCQHGDDRAEATCASYHLPCARNCWQRREHKCR